MKKLLVSISLLIMSSLVNAAAEGKKLTLIWKVGVDAEVFFPGCTDSHSFTCGTYVMADEKVWPRCRFSPVAGATSPIRLQFGEDPFCNEHHKKRHVANKTLTIDLPPTYASWDEIPNKAEIIAYYNWSSTQKFVQADLRLPMVPLAVTYLSPTSVAAAILRNNEE
jgi:hypothetical protein